MSSATITTSEMSIIFDYPKLNYGSTYFRPVEISKQSSNSYFWFIGPLHVEIKQQIKCK